MDIKNTNNNLQDEAAIEAIKKVKNKKYTLSKYIAIVGMMSALSIVFMYLNFPIFPLFSFLELDFSCMCSLIGGFVLGPVAALCIELIKIGLLFLVKPTVTAGIGEMSNLIVSLSFVMPPTILYSFKKGIKWTIIGLMMGILIGTFMACLSNYFVVFPLFLKMYGEFLLRGKALENVIFTVVLPFNIIKMTATSFLTFIVYKNISRVLKKF